MDAQWPDRKETKPQEATEPQEVLADEATVLNGLADHMERHQVTVEFDELRGRFYIRHKGKEITSDIQPEAYLRLSAEDVRRAAKQWE